MNENQRAAFIMAQAAVLQAEVAGMVAENQHRLSLGHSIAYGEDAFQAAIARSGCAHNDAVAFLRGI